MSFHRDSLPLGLILQHEAFRKTLDGRLLNAPVTEPVGRVLDIGTGSGLWAAEFATEHPTAEILGIDIFQQPTITQPSNCHLMIQDAEQDWEVGDAKFDVIHTRLVPFHAKELQAVLRRCYEHLKPGGYIEMQEVWPPCRTDEPPEAPEHASKVIEWTQLRLEAASKLGIDQAIAGQLPKILHEVGFVEVQTQDHKWPIGPWMEDEKMKDIGNIYLELLQLGKMDASKELLSHLGMEERQIINLVEQVGKELGIGKLYTPVRIVWARKHK
ncbi:sam dependent methyltransferase [Talaromyces proteolyticus]|uniref:Sam dependent methyltransferase n=1 Tax=Talaromyces proteolyticus TaxID=1131652 RepID=A0AAD4PVR0_9EURO|nr:sam dependent methyltransferase [Talaromyces proteolyticus]KAH8693787.1 sam dependent methyltransferase [Talaromyces proteolyticus]